jgi:hypothetical protein
MSNMKVSFWHSCTSGQLSTVELHESSFATGFQPAAGSHVAAASRVGTLSSTFYLAATDAQNLLDAMTKAGMKPTPRQSDWLAHENMEKISR